MVKLIIIKVELINGILGQIQVQYLMDGLKMDYHKKDI
jgi:hypothetical protein